MASKTKFVYKCKLCGDLITEDNQFLIDHLWQKHKFDAMRVLLRELGEVVKRGEEG